MKLSVFKFCMVFLIIALVTLFSGSAASPFENDIEINKENIDGFKPSRDAMFRLLKRRPGWGKRSPQHDELADIRARLNFLNQYADTLEDAENERK